MSTRAWRDETLQSRCLFQMVSTRTEGDVNDFGLAWKPRPPRIPRPLLEGVCEVEKESDSILVPAVLPESAILTLHVSKDWHHWDPVPSTPAVSEGGDNVRPRPLRRRELFAEDTCCKSSCDPEMRVTANSASVIVAELGRCVQLQIPWESSIDIAMVD